MSLVTIVSFNTYFDATPAQSLLDSHGIYCNLQNEHTATIDPVLKNSVYGVLLQVSDKDYDVAREILIEHGYYKEFEEEAPNSLLLKLDNITAVLPLIGGLSLVTRLLIIILPLLFIGIGYTVLNHQANYYDQLTTRSWCVDAVEYNGEALAVATLGRVVMSNNTCVDVITFYGSDELNLPGSHSVNIHGHWNYNVATRQLSIIQTDTLSDIYTGKYTIDIDGYQLVLQSDNTTIYATDSRGVYYRDIR